MARFCRQCQMMLKEKVSRLNQSFNIPILGAGNTNKLHEYITSLIFYQNQHDRYYFLWVYGKLLIFQSEGHCLLVDLWDTNNNEKRLQLPLKTGEKIQQRPIITDWNLWIATNQRVLSAPVAHFAHLQGREPKWETVFNEAPKSNLLVAGDHIWFSSGSEGKLYKCVDPTPDPATGHVQVEIK